MTYEQFIAELKQFCLDKGFEIAGTCESEGIFGEISVRRVEQPDGGEWTLQENPNWAYKDDRFYWRANIFNFKDDIR